MPEYPSNIKPDASPEMVDVMSEGVAVPAAERTVHVQVGYDQPTPIRWALSRWLRETRSSLALSFLPLIVLLVTAGFPSVAESAALRTLPPVVLVVYLPVLIWDIARLSQGRFTIDPFTRQAMRRWPSEPHLRTFIMRLIVALACLPALTVHALRAPFSGFPMVGLTVLPMFLYAIIVGVGGSLEGYFTITCGLY
jgi:hypothetical protein